MQPTSSSLVHHGASELCYLFCDSTSGFWVMTSYPLLKKWKSSIIARLIWNFKSTFKWVLRSDILNFKAISLKLIFLRAFEISIFGLFFNTGGNPMKQNYQQLPKLSFFQADILSVYLHYKILWNKVRTTLIKSRLKVKVTKVWESVFCRYLRNYLT